MSMLDTVNSSFLNSTADIWFLKNLVIESSPVTLTSTQFQYYEVRNIKYVLGHKTFVLNFKVFDVINLTVG